MKAACTTHEAIRFLLSRARTMTDGERHRQMVSLAYGNVTMENQAITRERVALFMDGFLRAPLGTRPDRDDRIEKEWTSAQPTDGSTKPETGGDR